jgi:hypothetical protein
MNAGSCSTCNVVFKARCLHCEEPFAVHSSTRAGGSAAREGSVVCIHRRVCFAIDATSCAPIATGVHCLSIASAHSANGNSCVVERHNRAMIFAELSSREQPDQTIAGTANSEVLTSGAVVGPE